MSTLKSVDIHLERSSTRLHAPPGGKSSFSLGGVDFGGESSGPPPRRHQNNNQQQSLGGHMRDNGRGGGGGMHDIPTQSLSNYSNRRGGDERGSGGRDGVGYGDRDRDRESRASAMKATFDHGAANYDSAPYANTRSNERDRNRDRDREGSNDYGRERSGGGRGGHREESLSNYAQQGSRDRDRDSGRDRDGYGSSSLSNYSNGRGGGGGGGGRRPSYGEDLGGTTDGYNNRSRNNSFSDDRSNARMDRYNGGTLPSSGKTSYEQDPRRHPSTRVHAPPGGHTSFSLG